MNNVVYRFSRGTENSEVIAVVHGEPSLDTLLDMFQNFLKACGYHVPGILEIVEHEEIECAPEGPHTH